MGEIEYLFREEDFNDDNFSGPQFVAKYRKVTTLESLREQLVSYSNNIRKQLYEIINRDYQDFINITTKLDGLDTRIEMIQRPLLDLQIDFSSLHNGIASSLHTIQDKLDQQQQIKIKKFYIETLLKCMEMLAQVQEAIHFDNIPAASSSTSSSDNPPGKQITRHQLFSIYCSDSYLANKDPAEVLQEKEVFICSEYERAAVLLESIQIWMKQLQQVVLLPIVTSHHLIDTAAQQTLQSVVQETIQVKAHLVQKLLTHLENDFVRAFTSSSSVASVSSADWMDDLLPMQRISKPKRAFAHCLKALLHLQGAREIENCLRKQIIEPYVKTMLTPGRVDGKSGRGSYSGLSSTLLAILQHIQQSALPEYLFIVEELVLLMQSASSSSSSNTVVTGTTATTTTSPLDLIVHSIWHPIQYILAEKYASLFTTGVTSILSTTFRALFQFLLQLSRLIPIQSPAFPPMITTVSSSSSSSSNKDVVDYAPIIFQRLVQHPDILATLASFQLDVYYSLRSKEMMTRLDKVCELHWLAAMVTRTNANAAPQPMIQAYQKHQMERLVEYFYNPSFATTTTSTTATTGANTNGHGKSQFLASLPYEDLLKLFSHYQPSANTAATYRYHHPFFLFFLLESDLLVQQEIVLVPLLSQFLTFHQKCLLRLCVHLVYMMNLSSGSLPTGLGELMTMKASELEVLRWCYCQELSSAEQLKVQQFMVQQNNNSPINSVSGNNIAGASSNAVGAKKKEKSDLFSPEKAPKESSNNATSSLGLSLPQPRTIVTLDEWVYVLLDGYHCYAHLTTAFLPRMITFVATLSNQFPINNTAEEENVQELVQSIYSPTLLTFHQLLTILWAQLLALISTECKRPLTSVKGIAGKYRMTNKPSPTVASTYVETILQPFKQLLSRFPEELLLLSSHLQSSTSTESAAASFVQMKLEIVETIVVAFQEQVNSLMETVKQMDTALQRRTIKTKVNESASQLSDVEKISLQVKLDVIAFGEEVKSVGVDIKQSVVYQALLQEVSK